MFDGGLTLCQAVRPALCVIASANPLSSPGQVRGCRCSLFMVPGSGPTFGSPEFPLGVVSCSVYGLTGMVNQMSLTMVPEDFFTSHG